MNEMIYEIRGSFNETEERMYGNITIDGVTTSHLIRKKSTTDSRVALLIMVAEALGFEPTEVVNFKSLKINEAE